MSSWNDYACQNVKQQSTIENKSETCPAVLTVHHHRDATGKFPDYPDAEDGGSAAIFKKREEVVSICQLAYQWFGSKSECIF